MKCVETVVQRASGVFACTLYALHASSKTLYQQKQRNSTPRVIRVLRRSRGKSIACLWWWLWRYKTRRKYQRDFFTRRTPTKLISSIVSKTSIQNSCPASYYFRSLIAAGQVSSEIPMFVSNQPAGSVGQNIHSCPWKLDFYQESTILNSQRLAQEQAITSTNQPSSWSDFTC